MITFTWPSLKVKSQGVVSTKQHKILYYIVSQSYCNFLYRVLELIARTEVKQFELN